MLASPSKSLAAALPEDVARLIRVPLSRDPDTARREYVDHHRNEEDRCRQLSKGFLEDHKKKLSLGRRLLKRAGMVHERYGSSVASVAVTEENGSCDRVQKLRARALLLLQLSEAVTIASLAAFRCWNEMETEAYRHARQAEIVENDVDYVLHLFSRHRFSPEQITHVIAIKADQFSMLKFLMPGFPGPSDGQPDDSEVELQGPFVIPFEPGGGPDLDGLVRLEEEAGRVAIVGTHVEAP